ncbi:two-component system, CitB family, sensor kinase [Micromonospora narathiwatensis]|uniref:histidine kinase n=2 Tax=Micromonospora narathiwatensis TaxID=299146 RepID=A0A1A8ZR06_9ACTN|nr:two-component system, CitB family, sensor kinase [Micromonospora narathiwatensis]
MLLQVVVVAIVAAAGFTLATLLLREELEQQYEQRALAIARSVAQRPGLAEEVRTGTPSVAGDVQRYAEQVRTANNALFVVIADRDGIRFSHTDGRLIGEHVSTDPSGPLAGREVVNVERGTLGLSARGKVPLRDQSGVVVGEVSVGIDADEIDNRLHELLPVAEVFTALALGVGVGGAALLAVRLKRRTLGLEPTDLADLVREQVAVLEGVRDGVLAVDAEGRVSVCTKQATRLLTEPVTPGAPATDEVLDLLEDRSPLTGGLRLLGDRVVAVTRRPVRRNGQDLGVVLTLRDHTNLDDMARELEATRALTDALRAQAHEHTNRLHALSGLLHLGDIGRAQAYLRELTATASVTAPPGRIGDPYLDGLLAAKTAVASEAGVTLRLGEDTWVPGRLTRPLDVFTVLGNLVDNAIRAATAGTRRPGWVEVSLLADERDLHIYVADSGDGIALADPFAPGTSTKEEPGRGLGLALARRIARSHGGDVRVGPVVPGQGAVFVAEIPGVLNPAAALSWEGTG